MASVASRELRNHTAEVLRRAQAGERIAVTVHGAVVAEIGPPRRRRPVFMDKAELLDVLEHHAADRGLLDDLAELAGDTTDDLDPL